MSRWQWRSDNAFAPGPARLAPAQKSRRQGPVARRPAREDVRCRRVPNAATTAPGLPPRGKSISREGPGHARMTAGGSWRQGAPHPWSRHPRGRVAQPEDPGGASVGARLRHCPVWVLATSARMTAGGGGAHRARPSSSERAPLPGPPATHVRVRPSPDACKASVALLPGAPTEEWLANCTAVTWQHRARPLVWGKVQQYGSHAQPPRRRLRHRQHPPHPPQPCIRADRMRDLGQGRVPQSGAIGEGPGSALHRARRREGGAAAPRRHDR